MSFQDDLIIELRELRKSEAEKNQRLFASLERLEKRVETQERQLEQLRHAAAFPIQNSYFKKVVANQLGYLETVEYVAERKVSLARFGDGEIGLACHAYRSLEFQTGSPQLSRALQNVLSDYRPNLLVGLPGFVADTTWLTMFARYWGVLEEVLPPSRTWGVSSVSRANAFAYHREALVDAWRACWEGRNVTVVTGRGSRFDPIDELFSNVGDINFEYGPTRNAFESLDQLTAQLLEKPLDLVIVALGPAATILAARLSDRGVQTLDIGHISNSYEQIFRNGPVPESLPIKR